MEVNTNIAAQTPHPFLYIPSNAPTKPFRITNGQFAALLRQTDDTFLLYAFDLQHLLFADGGIDSNDWTTTRYTHRIFRTAAEICAYRVRIANDLGDIVRATILHKRRRAFAHRYFLYLRSQQRFYITLQDVYVECILNVHDNWEEQHHTALPNDGRREVDLPRPYLIPGYVEPEIRENIVNDRIVWDSEPEEEEESESNPFDAIYFDSLRAIAADVQRPLEPANLDT